MDIQQLTNELLGRGWSQQSIADRVGASQSTISRIRLGQYRGPGLSLRIGDAIRALYTLEAASNGRRPAGTKAES